MTLNKKIFVISPLKIEYEDVYQVIRQVADELEISVFRSDEIVTVKSLLEHIHITIELSDLIICDLSESNSNVMYELGIARALNKPIIQICRSDQHVPFDAAYLTTFFYNRNNLLGDFKTFLLPIIKKALINPEEWTLNGYSIKRLNNKKLFISYSHKDKEYLDRLLIHLKPLEKQGVIDLWVDTRLIAGDKWKIKIGESLKNARVAILLVSADYLASDFIVDNELPPLLSNAASKGTRIIPIIIKPCRFTRDNNLSSFQAINDPKNPIVKMEYSQQEEIYDNVAELVESHMRTD